MKKFFITLIVLILLFVSLVAGVLFTKKGNDFIAQYIENKVNKEQNKVKLKVNNLSISLKNINFNATIDDNSNIDINGILDIFNQNVDLKYDIKIKELSNLESLINKKLNGPFSTSGTFVGNQKSAIIKGISNVASSDTKYDLELVEFNLNNIKLTSKSLKIDELLHLLNEPVYARGILNLNADIKSADINNLNGKVLADIQKGRLLNDVVNKKFNQNITIPIKFSTNIDTTLRNQEAFIKTDFLTSLFEIKAKQSVINLKSNNIYSDYALEIANLSKLESIINKKLKGSFSTKGKIELVDTQVKILGDSNVVNSQTSYDLILKDSILEKLNFSVKNAQLNELLKLLNEPIYARGDINIEGNLKSKNKNELFGNIKTNINDGTLINKVVNTVFDTKLKSNVKFNLNTNSKLQGDKISTDSNVVSTFGDFILRNGIFYVSKKSFDADYDLRLKDLSKLYELSSLKMRGNLNINGKIKSKNSSLEITGLSKIFGGNFDFILKNDNLSANLKKAKIKELLHMMYYPEIFDSSSNLNLKYNLVEKKGLLAGDLLKGHFLPNDFSFLINQFSKFDLTKEIYDTVKINTQINQSILRPQVNMRSKNTKIDLENAKIDLDKNLINSDIRAVIRKVNINAKVNGNLYNPQVTIDTKSLLKGKVGKKLDNLIENKIKDEKTKETLKSIKSLFE